MACGADGEHCVLLGKDDGISGASFAYTTNDMGQTWSESRTLPNSKNRTEYDEAQDISCSASGLICTIVGGMDGYFQGSYIVNIPYEAEIIFASCPIQNEMNHQHQRL